MAGRESQLGGPLICFPASSTAELRFGAESCWRRLAGDLLATCWRLVQYEHKIRGTLLARAGMSTWKTAHGTHTEPHCGTTIFLQSLRVSQAVLFNFCS